MTLPTVKEYIDSEIDRKLKEEKVANPAKAWELHSEAAKVYSASGYTSEGTTLADVIRKMLKRAERDGVLHDATSLVMEGGWQEGSGDKDGSYFSGTLTVCT